MYRKERQKELLDIIRKQGYTTVAALAEALHYSTATINRDLNEMEKQGLVKRSYGGVEPMIEQWISHTFRHQKMRKSKRRISARAAALVKNGDFIFVDGSTTAEYMAEFLREREELTVLTNNNILATELHPYGIRVICLGGDIVEEPCITGGDLCCRNAANFRVDKMFFSTGAVSSTGEIGGSSMLFSIVMRNAKEIYLLVDKEKINKPVKRLLGDFSTVTGVISDYEFPEETQHVFPNTQFICTEKTPEPDSFKNS